MYYRILLVFVLGFAFGGFVIPYMLSTNSDAVCYAAFGLIVVAAALIPKTFRFIVGKEKK